MKYDEYKIRTIVYKFIFHNYPHIIQHISNSSSIFSGAKLSNELANVTHSIDQLQGHKKTADEKGGFDKDKTKKRQFMSGFNK